MQEGHVDLDVVNTIHVSKLFQPYENQELRLILVVTDPSDIAGVLSYQLLHQKVPKATSLEGKAF